MRSLFAVSISISVLAISGCISIQEGNGEPNLPTTSVPSTPTPTTVQEPKLTEPVPPIPLSLAGSECTATASDSSWPAKTGPASPVPPGWEAQADLGSDIYLLFFDCSRVSMGSFERPMRMMWELHSKFDYAPECYHQETDLIWMIASLWVADAELADYLMVNYDLPVLLASFNLTVSVDNNLQTEKLTWKTADSAESDLTHVQPVEDILSPFPHSGRLVWFNETMLSFVDLDYEVMQNQLDPQNGYGTMKPPMLYASSGIETFAGPTAFYENATFSGKIQRFRDYQCEQPY